MCFLATLKYSHSTPLNVQARFVMGKKSIDLGKLYVWCVAVMQTLHAIFTTVETTVCSKCTQVHFLSSCYMVDCLTEDCFIQQIKNAPSMCCNLLSLISSSVLGNSVCIDSILVQNLAVLLGGTQFSKCHCTQCTFGSYQKTC